jgi:hypothetical protein
MDNSASKPVSTIVGNCPSCNGYVRLPLEARPDSTVRCPHCAATFSVASVLSLIPELEIVDVPTSQKVVPLVDRQSVERPAVIERKKFEVPHQLVSGAKRNRKHGKAAASEAYSRLPSAAAAAFTEPKADAADSEFLETDSLSIKIEPDQVAESQRRSSHGPREMSSDHVSRARVHSSQRYRRIKQEKQDPSLEVVKIILGGAMAFPIAYLILLWGLGQDPLRLAPSLSKTIPFIVPMKMRPEIGPGNPGFERSRQGKSENKSARGTKSFEGPTESIEVKPNRGSEQSLESIPDVAPKIK